MGDVRLAFPSRRTGPWRAGRAVRLPVPTGPPQQVLDVAPAQGARWIRRERIVNGWTASFSATANVLPSALSAVTL